MAIVWRLLLVLAVSISASGCSTVEPWQRGTLAKKQMEPNPRPLQSKLRQHVQNSREAASGGTTSAGGGCGCY